MVERGLVRPRDGLHLDTDFRSLTDVDGDGIEIGEVVRAVLMVPPGSESMGVESDGGQLLYAEVDPANVSQSAVEVSLRAELKSLEEKLQKVHFKVQNHQNDLQQEGARDTKDFIHGKAENLAKLATHLAHECSSDADRQRQASIENRVADLANAASSLAKEIRVEFER